MEAIQGLIIMIVVMIFYLAPTWVAKKGRRGGVFVINAFLGWTFVFWIVALYLAVRSHEAAKGGA